MRNKLTDAQRAEVRAIGALVRGSRPRYPVTYIAALYGVAVASVSYLLAGGPRVLGLRSFARR